MLLPATPYPLILGHNAFISTTQLLARCQNSISSLRENYNWEENWVHHIMFFIFFCVQTSTRIFNLNIVHLHYYMPVNYYMLVNPQTYYYVHYTYIYYCTLWDGEINKLHVKSMLPIQYSIFRFIHFCTTFYLTCVFRPSKIF